jgi:NAD(P)-dependent dehydrogenase (short-subunit alcohol dehydrogenase family)
MDAQIEGLRVLVTAGASGIGLATARAFAAEGARVFICDIDRTALAVLAESAPAFGQVVCDVADPAAVERMFASATSALGGLDALVNNAGIAGPTAPCEGVALADWQRTLAVNLTGQFLCAQRAIPLLKTSANPSIANLSSAAGRFGYPMRTPYAASKWGVIGFKSLSGELGPFGIRVNAICRPGASAHRKRSGEQGRRARAGGRRSRGGPCGDVVAQVRKRRGHRQRDPVSRFAQREQHLRTCPPRRRRSPGTHVAAEGFLTQHPFDLSARRTRLPARIADSVFRSHEARRSRAPVVLNGRKPEALAASANTLTGAGLSASTSVFDVSDGEAVRTAVGAIESERGSIDILVNNPAFGGEVRSSTSSKRIGRHHRDQSDGALSRIQAVLAGMIARKRGKIIIASR